MGDSRVLCIAYADQLKEICSTIFGIPVQRFYQNKSNAWICLNDKFQYTEIKPDEEHIVTAEDYYYNLSGYSNNNDIKYSVTLKSHLFENDGKYIFNDMMQSTDLWVERNGETYGIIIDSVSVEETTNNNIYEATVKYHYSQEPSLI